MTSAPHVGSDFLGLLGLHGKSAQNATEDDPELEYVVLDNPRLEATGPGLAFHATPRVTDWDGANIVPWGTKLRGRVVGDWLKTPKGYLPFKYRGIPVLEGVEPSFSPVYLPRDPLVPSIVGSTSPRTWWGFPSYVKYLDTGLQSWNELARLHGHLGNTCSEQDMLQKCGTALICRAGICGECEVSRDCSEKFKCQRFPQSGRKMCVRRDLAEQWTWREAVLTVLIIITAMLSAAAGMGGGGVYVPLLLLLLEFSTKEAVPLSQAMIVGGATVNIIMFSGDRHPKFPNRPKIDYEVVTMLNPGLAAGVTVGVMLNVISPQWVIVLVLLVTLVLALQKSLVKGLKEWHKESKALAKAAEVAKTSTKAAPAVDQASSNGSGGLDIKLPDFKS